MMIYAQLHPKFELDHLGYLPGMLLEDDPRPAKEQYDANYKHGGGWRPMPGWKIVERDGMTIQYPGDPPLKPIAMTTLRDEYVFFYQHAFVLIMQQDETFEIARMD